MLSVSIQKIFFGKKYLWRLQFWTNFLPYKHCVVEKRKYVNKGCNLVNPYPITVLLTIPFNKVPSFGTQFSSTGVQEPFCKHWLSIVVERFPVIAQHLKIVFTKPLHFIRFSPEGLLLSVIEAEMVFCSQNCSYLLRGKKCSRDWEKNEIIRWIYLKSERSEQFVN